MLSGKNAILIVSFGTLKNVARTSCIDQIIDRVKILFPEYEVKNVFTSERILQKIEKETMNIFSLRETLENLLTEGYKNVIIQPTLLTAGQEYQEKVLKVSKQYETKFINLKIGPPAILPNKNIDLVMEAFNAQIELKKPDEEIIFMGHGSKNKHNPLYEELQKSIDKICSYMTIGVLEKDDCPNIDDVLVRLQQKKRKKVYLMPLLFVAGMHVIKDMLGDEQQSWKNRLLKAGYEVRTYDKGLGENKFFQNIYIENIKEMITNN